MDKANLKTKKLTDGFRSIEGGPFVMMRHRHWVNSKMRGKFWDVQWDVYDRSRADEPGYLDGYFGIVKGRTIKIALDKHCRRASAMEVLARGLVVLASLAEVQS